MRHSVSGPADSAPILYVAFQLDNLANGGLESASQILERIALPRVVVTQRETAFCDRWRRAGCEVLVWPDDGPRSLRVTRFNTRALALILERRIRVVHCNDIAAFWHTAMGARLAGARVLFNVRDIFEDGRPYGPRWRLTHHLANEIVCLSQEMRTTVLERFPPQVPGLKQALVSVTPSAIDLRRMRPVDPDRRASLRLDLGMREESFEIIYVAAVCEKKNQLQFLTEAVPQLVAVVPHARITFVGDFRPGQDPYARACEQAVHDRGLGAVVRFVGFSRDTAPHYQAADVVCLASRYEGLARSMIEGMACGTPVVAFDVTSAREYLAATGAGIVATKYDFSALVRGLKRLADDPAERESMGRRAREVAEDSFDPDKSVSAYLRRYLEWGRR